MAKKTDKPSDAEDIVAVADMDYATVNAAIAVTQANMAALVARKAELETAYARGDHYKDAIQTTFLSDEGVSVAQLSGHRIVNVTDPTLDLPKARKSELRVNGRVYQHVANTADGQWIYRSDK